MFASKPEMKICLDVQKVIFKNSCLLYHHHSQLLLNICEISFLVGYTLKIKSITYQVHFFQFLPPLWSYIDIWRKAPRASKEPKDSTHNRLVMFLSYYRGKKNPFLKITSEVFLPHTYDKTFRYVLLYPLKKRPWLIFCQIKKTRWRLALNIIL